MSGSLTTWQAGLRPASWRGIEFKVLEGAAVAGRRVHLHEYPFRDTPWPEDLGRRSRTLSIRGYLIGDDVADQLDALTEAAEQKGSGELVHPFRGSMDLVLLAMPTEEAWDRGRVVRVTFEFVQAGERRFPGSTTDGKAEVKDAAKDLDKAAGESAQAGILDGLKSGYAGAQSMVRTAQGYVAMANRLASSATGAIRSVTALAGVSGIGNLGRYIGGSSRGGLSVLGSVTSLSGGISAAVSRFNGARNAVSRLGSNLVSLVGGL